MAGPKSSGRCAPADVNTLAVSSRYGAPNLEPMPSQDLKCVLLGIFPGAVRFLAMLRWIDLPNQEPLRVVPHFRGFPKGGRRMTPQHQEFSSRPKNRRRIIFPPAGETRWENWPGWKSLSGVSFGLALLSRSSLRMVDYLPREEGIPHPNTPPQTPDSTGTAKLRQDAIKPENQPCELVFWVFRSLPEFGLSSWRGI